MEAVQTDSGINEVLQKLTKLLRTLEYGSLEIVVHNSKVVQINRIEKFRVEKDQPTYCI